MATDDGARAFLLACRLDVQTLKPGNVSVFGAGHGMTAAQFVTSAQAAVEPLFARGATVGERILGAVQRTRDAVGCNTNLGIVLLVAPLAAALEALEASDAAASAKGWRAATERVLAALDVADTRAAYRAIQLANPGGLGDAPEQPVKSDPTVDLRAAMALAADRDSIARQYANGFRDIFDTGLAAAHASGDTASGTLAMLEVFFAFVGRWPDSHILRKHGEAAAQSVTRDAIQIHRQWRDACARQHSAAPPLVLQQWDAELKRRGLNPGTSADLAVATLFVDAVLTGRARAASDEEA